MSSLGGFGVPDPKVTCSLFPETFSEARQRASPSMWEKVSPNCPAFVDDLCHGCNTFVGHAVDGAVLKGQVLHLFLFFYLVLFRQHTV